MVMNYLVLEKMIKNCTINMVHCHKILADHGWPPPYMILQYFSFILINQILKYISLCKNVKIIIIRFKIKQISLS